ncbi:hypothetical protein MML48_2g00021539 [Holotrichia oblita]|uniref:Uncharacterized protein n=1 Tax=Holotrichia oblita TaxID=644536 RepID=A0ACB9TKU6_HOLOL|nr:hypothetical protein MML48_2g00021539 [Holotrichia oblita]
MSLENVNVNQDDFETFCDEHSKITDTATLNTMEITAANTEEGKPVPALTSMLYGRRPLYDSPPGKHNRRAHIQNFYRKRQVFAGPEKQRFTEDVNFNI